MELRQREEEGERRSEDQVVMPSGVNPFRMHHPEPLAQFSPGRDLARSSKSAPRNAALRLKSG